MEREQVCSTKLRACILKTKKEVTRLIDKYEFGQALHLLYDFFWHEFCDVYLETSKKEPSVEVLRHVLCESLKLLHPFMPFITEAIWKHFGAKPLIIEKWPS